MVLFLFQSKAKVKNHDFTRYTWGEDYVFEAIEDGKKGYITGYGKRIKPEDLILLKNTEGISLCCRVEVIDYYCDPPDMWTALVKIE